MSFRLRWLAEASKQFNEIEEAALRALGNRNGKGKSSKQEGLYKQLVKCVENLQANPKHPSLKTHESGIANPFDPRQKTWEAYIQNNTPGAHRLFWCYGPEKGEITVIAITPHP